MSMQLIKSLSGRSNKTFKNWRIFRKTDKIILFLGYNSLRLLSTSQIRVSSAEQVKEQSTQQNDEPVDMENPFKKEEKKCILCQMQIAPNYKNVRLLSQFQSPYTGRIYGRHITGLCRAQQERVEREIKRSQDSGHMPAYHKIPELMRDPRLFDPERPIRPHKY